MNFELIKGSFYRALYLGISFGTGLLLAALAGTELYGTISLMVVNTAILLIFTGLGTDAALVWHWSGEKIKPATGFSFVLLTAALQLFLFGVGEYLMIKFQGRTLLTGRPGTADLSSEVMYFTGMVWMEKWTNLFYAHQRPNRANAWLAGVSLIFLAVLGAAYQKAGIRVTDPIALFAGFTFVQGLVLLVVFSVFTLPVGPGKITWAETRGLFSFSLLVFVTNTLQFLAYRIDYWFLEYYQDDSTVGIYAQANRFAQLLWFFPTIWAGLLIPQIARKEAPLGREGFIRQTRQLTFVTLLLLPVVLIAAWLLYRYFLPSGFQEGYSVLIRMIPGYALFSLTLLLAAWFSAQGKLKVNLIGSLLCLALIGAADACWIPRYGLHGAAWANTFAYSLTTLYFILRFRSHTKGKERHAL